MVLLGGLLKLKRKLNKVRKIKLYIKLCVKLYIKYTKYTISAINK